MKVIGITGGVGAGKTTLLDILKNEFDWKIIMADEVGKEVMQKGEKAYQEIVKRYGNDILLEDGELDREKIAKIIFKDIEEKEAMDAIIHPAVKEKILKMLENWRKENVSYVAVEAALLIEDGYQKICDELWYIKVSKEERTKRLKENRGYSLDKIEAIMQNQLTEEEFSKACDRIFVNDGSIEHMRMQIRNTLKNPEFMIN